MPEKEFTQKIKIEIENQAELKRFIDQLEQVGKTSGRVMSGQASMPNQRQVAGAEKWIESYLKNSFGQLQVPPQVKDALKKDIELVQAQLKKLHEVAPDSAVQNFTNLNKQVKHAGVGMGEWVKTLGVTSTHLTSLVQGILRGSIPQILSGGTGAIQTLGGFAGKAVGEAGRGGASQIGQEVTKRATSGGGTATMAIGQVGKVLGPILAPILGVVGLAAAAMGATGLALAGLGAANVLKNFKEASTSEQSMIRAEDMMGKYGQVIGTSYMNRWEVQQGAKYGIKSSEVANTMQGFMMAGGKAGTARTTVDEALQMQKITGKSADTFANSVAAMERWVPKGDFSKSISRGFMDSQRYGQGYLGRSGEWQQAQESIVRNLSFKGGWQNAGLESSSRNLMLTMSKFGYGGAPGGQAVGGIAGSLPGMLSDPMKAAAAYNVFGLTPMQMLRPGMKGAGGTTAVEQILSRAQTPEFKRMVGGEFGAGLYAQGMGWDPEIFMRMVKGEKIAPKEVKDMLGAKAKMMMDTESAKMLAGEIGKANLEAAQALQFPELVKKMQEAAEVMLVAETGSLDASAKMIESVGKRMEKSFENALMKKGMNIAVSIMDKTSKGVDAHYPVKTR